MTNTLRKFAKKLTAAGLALTLAISSLTGCSGADKPAESSSLAQTGEPVNQATTDAFLDLCIRIATEELAADGLTLHYTLANPEALGIKPGKNILGDFSQKKLEEEAKKCEAFKTELEAIDPDSLSAEHRFTYKVLMEKLGCTIEATGFPYYYEPLQPSIGLQAELPILLAEYPFRNKTDIANYLELLADFERYYGQLLAYEQEKAAAGLFMCDEAADLILADLDSYLKESEGHVLVSSFIYRVGEVDFLTEEEKTTFIQANESLIQGPVLTAFRTLADGIRALKSHGSQGGLAGLPAGKKYYMHLMKANVGSDRTADEIKTMIKDKLDEDLGFLRETLRNRPELAQEALAFAFSKTEPDEILKDIVPKMAEDFPVLETEVSYDFKYVAKELEGALSPAFYLVPPVDALAENVIYINQGATNRRFLYGTLAHEGFPGHLYQTVYSYACMEDDLIRRLCGIPGFSEGWATYAEYYAYSYDTGNDATVTELAMRNNRISLAVYALLDYYINYENYSLDDVADFLKSMNSSSDETTVRALYYTMVAQPTNYMNYFFGYLEIESMYKAQEKALGKQFDAKSFHKFILERSGAPFYLIREGL